MNAVLTWILSPLWLPILGALHLRDAHRRRRFIRH